MTSVAFRVTERQTSGDRSFSAVLLSNSGAEGPLQSVSNSVHFPKSSQLVNCLGKNHGNVYISISLLNSRNFNKEIYGFLKLFSEVFSGQQPRQMIYKLQRFGDKLHLHHWLSYRPDDGNGVGLRYVGVYKSSNAAVYPRKPY